MVDLLGHYDLLPSFTTTLDAILKKKHYEYADCYVCGVINEIFDNAGWEDVDKADVIIPNYFAPFERKNIDIYYSCKPHGMVILHGDGDQDRPN